ncbi:RNA polymerase sigma factor [Marinoscillum furvescens]|uniref:RNA polymerase sigma-70 factor (ECF subfamily) n=1 Tax=Marinoscillum furvescens DSM 4134 TaxID=1122208 RepID=A0A3D9L267_MARFU|nr:sigma-70 family RNA polymerase sigma factor [Marinoscillum furvescens]RED95264.1 RNA polymerase sigma-70 factor (ECF subfamily) [Marinoscillum furvescens DSM 4134]
MKKSTKVRRLDHDAGFRAWFENVYETHFERLFRYAFSIMKDRQAAEDVVSEVFLNIWNKKPDYDHIKELTTYLHVSVKHLAIRNVSKDPGKFSYSTYDETLQITDAIDPESILLGAELQEVIDHVIADLPPHGKLVYELSKLKGYSNQQIADEMGISKKTVESHLYAVLKKVKEALYQHFNDNQMDYPYFTNISSVSLLLACMVVGLC